jgi:hypothetical protein
MSQVFFLNGEAYLRLSVNLPGIYQGVPPQMDTGEIQRDR